MLSSPHAGIFRIVLNSLESRPLLDYAKQATNRPLLECAKKSGKQTFDRLCLTIHMQAFVGLC